MKTIDAVRLALSGLLLMTFAATQAQTEGQVSDQADVWAEVERQWNSVEKKDDKWIDRMLTDDFSGWGKGSPAPRGKASTKMWTRFNEQVSEMVAHELYPLSIVVHGDMAVVHYLYTQVVQEKDRSVTRSNGRYTDVLVRDGDSWRFIAWHGGDD